MTKFSQSKLATWFSTHVYLAMALAVATVVLAGTAGFAATQLSQDASQQDRSSSSRTSGSRLSNIALGSKEAPEVTPPVAPSEAPVPQPVAKSPSPAAAPAVAAAAPGFSITCPQAKVVNVQAGDSFTCKVTSINGFSKPVVLSCPNPPPGLDCMTNEKSVTPPPNGSEEFHLGLSNNSVMPGNHSFKVVGTSGAISASFLFPFDLKPEGATGQGAPPGNNPSPTAPNNPAAFTLDCNSAPKMVEVGTTGDSVCTVRSTGFAGTVVLQLNQPNPAGPTLKLSRPNVDVFPGSSAQFAVMIDPGTANPGIYPYTVLVDAQGGGNPLTRNLTVHLYGTPTPAPTDDPPPAG